MKTSFVSRRMLSTLILVAMALTITDAQGIVQAAPALEPALNHCSCLHNATEQKSGISPRGAWGYINYTDPPLNGGQWSYHRVTTVLGSPWRFVEWGWQKRQVLFGTELRGLIAYDSGGGPVNVGIGGVSAATHRYSLQYDPPSAKYIAFLDGVQFWNGNVGFSTGSFVTAGGEVYLGVESMYSTYLSDLRYLKQQPDGTWAFTLWNGHTNYVDNAPYSNIDGGLNAFYDFGN